MWQTKLPAVQLQIGQVKSERKGAREITIRHEKDNNGKRPQWKKDTRKKFTVHRKTALRILVKRSQ